MDGLAILPAILFLGFDDACLLNKARRAMGKEARNLFIVEYDD